MRMEHGSSIAKTPSLADYEDRVNNASIYLKCMIITELFIKVFPKKNSLLTFLASFFSFSQFLTMHLYMKMGIRKYF